MRDVEREITIQSGLLTSVFSESIIFDTNYFPVFPASEHACFWQYEIEAWR